jgi:hypothetical protein
MKRAPFHLEIPNDEVPYSTIARYAYIGGFRAPIALKQIFNNPKKRIHPFLPGLLNNFSEFFDLNPIEVITHKTIYPLVKFAQPSAARAILNVMKWKTDDRVISSTALGHSRFSTFYGLKDCPQCVIADIEKYGFTYWHINHQIPGTEACFKHHCLLNAVAMGEGQRDRALFLPSFEIKQPCSANQHQIKFASFSAELLTTLQTKQSNFTDVYRQLLQQLGLICSSGKNLKTSEILKLASHYWKDLEFSEQGVPAVLNDFKFIGPILRDKTNSPAHPIKHILLAALLTNNDVSLLFKGNKIVSNEDGKSVNNKNEDQVLKLLKTGKSLNEVEKLSGHSRCYIRRIAELNRIPHQTNSLKYSDEVRRAVLIKALYGISRNEMVKDLKVGLGYVEQIICNEPNMSKWRKHLRIQKNILAACRHLTAIRKEYPNWNRTQIRKYAESDYFILYNHDQSLIEEILPSPLAPKRYYKDWNKEDSRLFQAISKLENIESLSLSAIGRLVNDHSYILRSIEKLPKTRQLLIEQGKIES